MVRGFRQCLAGGEVGGVNNSLVFSKDRVISIGKLHQRLIKEMVITRQGYAVEGTGAYK